MTSMWRRFLALFMVFGLLTAACGSDSDSSSSSGSAAEEEPAQEFKIGLVTDTGKVDDKAFNQSAWEGALAGAAQIEGATTDYIETEESKDDQPKGVSNQDASNQSLKKESGEGNQEEGQRTQD